jgi:two-component system nitrate/nitrite response regulator NarL
MSVAANSLSANDSIRVAIYAMDLARRLALSKLVATLGHVVVADQNAADVILAEGGEPIDPLKRPIIIIGDGDHDAPGALSPQASASQIDAALRAVAAGLIVRSPDRADPGFDSIPESGACALLTPRELEVLAAVAEGDSNKAIARRLGISLHTVKFHIESLFRKLGARTRTEAVAIATERHRRETITL